MLASAGIERFLTTTIQKYASPQECLLSQIKSAETTPLELLPLKVLNGPLML
jgi:hypothetical protein